jgi:hypothetical protein
MMDSSEVKPYFENNLSYSRLYTKSEKPIKAVKRHLPQNTPAEELMNW